VTPQTVQAAIETLSRPEIYSRAITVEQLWSGGQTSYEILVTVDADRSRTDRNMPDGRVRHSIMSGDVTYIWYDEETAYYTTPTGGFSADEEQGIPTYEDILELLPEEIIAADYRSVSGVNCIYVETKEDVYGYTLRYWVSVDTGLLTAAERLHHGETVYRMAALATGEPESTAEVFLLPDGTVVE